VVSFGGIVTTGVNLALGLLGGGGMIGMLGPCVFSVSEHNVKTFSALSRKSSARHVDHEVISQKQVSEFTGADLDEVELTMMFNSDLGVSPEAEVEMLRFVARLGEPMPLMLGGSFFGLWTIREIPETWLFMRSNGSCQIMTINVTIKEFINSVPTSGQSKQAQDEASRAETGKGGPEKLPGSSPRRPMNSATN
jgi:phage protein U